MLKIKIGGSPYHKELQKSIVKDIPNVELTENWRVADVYYWISGFPHFLLINIFFWIQKKPLILVHWIGSDVMALTSFRDYKQRFILLIIKYLQRLKPNKIVHVAVHPSLVDELRRIGVIASYFPITSIGDINFPSTKSMQKCIDFLSYIPKSKFKFYGGNYFVNLAKRLPQYRFAVVMPDVLYPSELPWFNVPNIFFYSKLSSSEMQSMYKLSKCLIRLTEHDGLPLSVLESLYHQLHVIWNHRLPYVLYLKNNFTLEELRIMADTLIKSWEPNYLGSRYVVKNFSKTTLRFNFEKLLKNVSETA